LKLDVATGGPEAKVYVATQSNTTAWALVWLGMDYLGYTHRAGALNCWKSLIIGIVFSRSKFFGGKVSEVSKKP